MKKTLTKIILTAFFTIIPSCAFIHRPQTRQQTLQTQAQESKEKKRFEETKFELGQAGFKISFSRFYPNSGILIYLPDDHNPEQTKRQLLNIHSINKTITPDIYFLESLSGEINQGYLERIEPAREKRKKGLESLALEDFFLSTLPLDFALALRDKKCYGIENQEEFFIISLLGQADLVDIRKRLCAVTIASYLERTTGKNVDTRLIEAMSSSQLSDYLKIYPIDQRQAPAFQGFIELMKEQEQMQSYLEKRGIKDPKKENAADYIYRLRDKRSITAARNIKKQLTREQIGLFVYGALHESSLLKELRALKQTYITIDTGFH